MATPKKTKSGNWRIRLYIGLDSNGHEKFTSITRPTRRECELAAAAYRLNEGSVAKRSGGMTVGEAVDGYIIAKSNLLSPTTVSKYKSIRQHRFKSLMNVKLSDISTPILQAAVNAEVREVSPKTIKNAYGLVSAAVKMYSKGTDMDVRMPTQSRAEPELPPPERVLQATAGTSVELPVLLAIWKTLRLSEVMGLQYGDFSPMPDGSAVARVNRVRLTVDRKQVVKTRAKTEKSNRSFDVPAFIYQKIAAMEQETGAEKTDFIIPESGETVAFRFKHIMKQNGMPEMHFHSLRHIAASIMLKIGVPNKYAMEIGGWSTPSVMKNVYQNTFTADREAANQKVNDFFEKIVKRGLDKGNEK